MKNIINLSLVFVIFTIISCNSSTKNESENIEEKILKESDLPSNPETIEEIATVFYFNLKKMNYEEAEKFYSGKLHQFEGDEPCDCYIENIEVDKEKGIITFLDPVNKNDVKLTFRKQNEKYEIMGYLTTIAK